MSTKVSPTLIGAFVVGALALLIVAVIAFGSGQLFRKTQQFILYFDGSVNGLRIGAPVKFMGVEVGSVKDIRLEMQGASGVHMIPVIIEIDLKKVIRRGVARAEAMDPNTIREFVKQGMRGQLLTESLVTGVLYVGFDWFPETPLRFVQQPGGHFQYEEIPTVPTGLEEAQDALVRVVKKLDDIDFKALAGSLTKTSDRFGELAGSPALKSILKSLDDDMPELRGAILDFRRLAATANTNVTNVSADLHNVSGDLHQTLTAAQSAIEQISATMKEAQTTIVSMRGTVDPNSPTVYELTKSLREVSGAASSIRLLADSLDRNPQAVILGKPETQEGK
jgi:phospholipid/cholesterol/gamma-HCH transport system substrate-binding protein